MIGSTAHGDSAIDGLARAVHDLHGPLTVIRGMCATLLRDEPATDRRRALGLIDSEALRLAAGLRGLTHVAAAGSGYRPSCDLAALVTATARRFGALAEQREMRLVVRGRRAPAPVAGDPARLGRALDNLIWNALRHAGRGGTVVVGIAVRSGHAEVHVRDDGAGVAPADRERIFLAGERGSAPRGPGEGLGLAIAREIVDAAGGRLSLDAVGSGACFRIRLPLRPAADPGPRAA